MKQMLRHLPAIHELQQDPRFAKLEEKWSKAKATEWVQEAVAELRKELLEETWVQSKEVIDFIDEVFMRVSERLSEHSMKRLQRVINGTGTVLHTNLGRARLSERATEQVAQTAQAYSNLEYNLIEGKRGSRHDLIEDIVKEITGAEAAMVVNNNAAAVYLILKALAKEKEVIVSRGELVEIGGSFRVSSIMEESGARLIEVGTTNKTHQSDYERAISENTAMIMKVHTSNFKIIGFTKEIPASELKHLTQTNQIILFEDLGSGAIYDLRLDGIGNEPTVAEALMHADIVSFSGDKLLGGPQVGMIAGKKALIDKLKKHQLARVLRVDKMTLAALEATLSEYRDLDKAKTAIPTLKAILLTKEEVRARIATFKSKIPASFLSEIIDGTSQVGGGTMPEVELDTCLLKLNHQTMKAHEIQEQLRKGSPAVVGRIQEDALLFDFRTIDEVEFADLEARLQEFAN